MRVVLIKTDSVQGLPPLLYLGTSEDTPSDSFPQAGCVAGPQWPGEFGLWGTWGDEVKAGELLPPLSPPAPRCHFPTLSLSP